MPGASTFAQWSPRSVERHRPSSSLNSTRSPAAATLVIGRATCSFARAGSRKSVTRTWYELGMWQPGAIRSITSVVPPSARPTYESTCGLRSQPFRMQKHQSAPSVGLA
jgi:hypothetical protein